MAHRPKQKPSAPAPAPKPARGHLLIAAILAILVLAVYAQVRNHRFLNFDDPIYLNANPHVLAGLSADSIRWAFTSLDTGGAWHPVTWLTHMTAVELFGVREDRHLLINVFFHLANTLLLFFLLRKMTGSEARSAIVAALFAVHPLHVESVAWLAERKDVVSTLLMLLTLWMYAEFVRTRSRGRYALALLFFALGLMSKGMLVTLPFVLLLLDYWPLNRFELRDARAIGKLTLEKIPFFLLLIPSIAVTLLGQKEAGAVGTVYPLSTRTANAIVSYGAYLWKTIWPLDLAVPYPWRTPIQPLHVAVSAIVVVAISVTAIRYARTNRALFTGWFWFVGMLVPVIGLIQIGSQSMADRYTYLPHIGLFMAVVWLVADALSLETRQLAAMVAIVLVGALALVAHRQVTYWRDSITLFSRAISVTAPNSVAHLNLGSAIQHAGDPERGLQELRTAVEIEPTSAWMLVMLARLELQLGRMPEATTHLQTAYGLKANPETLALLAIARNDTPGAVAAYAQAVAKEPESAALRNDYGASLARAQRNDEALAQYREAIRLAPETYDAHMNIGAILSRLGRNGEARDAFSTAATIRPGSPEPHIYLALLNANTGRLDLALMNVQTAMAIDPVQANAMFTNAVRAPPKSTNLQEFVEFLQSKQAAPPPSQ
jgi:tetratricopeptide (TPR) repeat protein